MFRIRPAGKEDHHTIVNFQLQMAKESEGIDLDPNTLTKGVLAVFADPQKGIYLVVEDGETMIASMLITYEWSDWRNKNVYWFQSVFVLPQFRGKKVFSLMYEYVKTMAEDNPNCAGIRLYVDTSNENAIKVYNAVGMDGSHYKTFEWMKNN